MRIHTVAVIVAACAAIGIAVVPAAEAATSARLEVDLPMAASAGNAVVYAGSVQVNDSGKITCLPISNPSGGNGRIIFRTNYQVVVGKSYGISAWETTKCDIYSSSMGRRTRSLGGVTATPRSGSIADGVWKVRI